MCIYGNPAYPHRIYLQCPFARRQELTPAQQGVNQSMSEVRVSVDWVFGDVVNYFKFIDFKKNLKIGLSAVGEIYIVCALFHNALTCLYGNNTSTCFGVKPPTLEEYFGQTPCIDSYFIKQLFYKLPDNPRMCFPLVHTVHMISITWHLKI